MGDRHNREFERLTALSSFIERYRELGWRYSGSGKRAQLRGRLVVVGIVSPWIFVDRRASGLEALEIRTVGFAHNALRNREGWIPPSLFGEMCPTLPPNSFIPSTLFRYWAGFLPERKARAST